MTKQFELLQNTMARPWYSEEERESSGPNSDESSDSRENGGKEHRTIGGEPKAKRPRDNSPLSDSSTSGIHKKRQGSRRQSK